MQHPAPSRKIATIAGIALLFGTGISQAGLDDLTLVAASVADARAVIRTADGNMRVIKAGDRLPGSDAVVTEVLRNRVVAEETVQGTPPTKQLVWISRDGTGRSRVQRLHREPPEKSIEIPPQGAHLLEPGTR